MHLHFLSFLSDICVSLVYLLYFVDFFLNLKIDTENKLKERWVKKQSGEESTSTLTATASKEKK